MTVRVMAGWRRRRQQRRAAGEALVGRLSRRGPTPARMHGPARHAVGPMRHSAREKQRRRRRRDDDRMHAVAIQMPLAPRPALDHPALVLV